MRLYRWDQCLSTNETNQVLFPLAARLLDGINHPSEQALRVKSFVEAQDYKSLCLFELDVNQETVESYRALRQVLAFFNKRRDLDIGVDTKAVAWAKAKEAEQLCLETNQIFRLKHSGGFFFPLDVESALFKAQRKIASILGDLPALSDLKLRFGPGATTQVKKKNASARRKLSQSFCCSEDAIQILPDLLAELPAWVHDDGPSNVTDVEVLIHEGRIDFVRKNAKTDRTISVEPMLNSMCQLGIGDYMASRLRSFGVDLSNQARNQELAREGSLTGALATLDLSSASDTIAMKVVEDLLPVDWWLFLSSLRTGSASTPDGRMKLQKFSSMGNGFTFPLESLIFYALAFACAENEPSSISVYGDDIVIPVHAVPLLKKVLHCCGFLLNAEKSFFSGPFRESCGKDYFSGINVRPCYIKDALSGHTCFTLHNFWVRAGQPELASLLLEVLDESLVLWGPDGYGDGHLIGDYEPCPLNRQRGWSGFTFETYTYKPKKAFYKLGADYVYPSYSIYMKGEVSSPLPMLDDQSSMSRFRFAKRFHKAHLRAGAFRPEREDAVYSRVSGKVSLVDTLPGVDGYKRIKIYILG
jgi:hypothetical protein